MAPAGGSLGSDAFNSLRTTSTELLSRQGQEAMSFAANALAKASEASSLNVTLEASTGTRLLIKEICRNLSSALVEEFYKYQDACAAKMNLAIQKTEGSATTLKSKQAESQAAKKIKSIKYSHSLQIQDMEKNYQVKCENMQRDCDRKIRAIETKMIFLTEQIKKERNEMDDVKYRKIQMLEQSLEDVTEARRQNINEMMELKKELEETSPVLAKLKEQVKVQETKYRELEISLHTERECRQAEVRRSEKLKSQLSFCHESIKNLEEKIKEKEEEVVAANANAQRYLSASMNGDKILQELRDDAVQARAALDEAKAQASTATTEMIRMKEERSSLQEKLKMKSEESRAYKLRADEYGEAIKTEQAEFHRTYDRLQRKIRELTDSNFSLSERNAELETTSSDQALRLEYLNSCVKNSEELHQKMKEELQWYKETMESRYELMCDQRQKIAVTSQERDALIEDKAQAKREMAHQKARFSKKLEVYCDTFKDEMTLMRTDLEKELRMIKRTCAKQSATLRRNVEEFRFVRKKLSEIFLAGRLDCDSARDLQLWLVQNIERSRNDSAGADSGPSPSADSSDAESKGRAAAREIEVDTLSGYPSDDGSKRGERQKRSARAKEVDQKAPGHNAGSPLAIDGDETILILRPPKEKKQKDKNPSKDKTESYLCGYVSCPADSGDELLDRDSKEARRRRYGATDESGGEETMFGRQNRGGGKPISVDDDNSDGGWGSESDTCDSDGSGSVHSGGSGGDEGEAAGLPAGHEHESGGRGSGVLLASQVPENSVGRKSDPGKSTPGKIARTGRRKKKKKKRQNFPAVDDVGQSPATLATQRLRLVTPSADRAYTPASITATASPTFPSGPYGVLSEAAISPESRILRQRAMGHADANSADTNASAVEKDGPAYKTERRHSVLSPHRHQPAQNWEKKYPEDNKHAQHPPATPDVPMRVGDAKQVYLMCQAMAKQRERELGEWAGMLARVVPPARARPHAMCSSSKHAHSPTHHGFHGSHPGALTSQPHHTGHPHPHPQQHRGEHATDVATAPRPTEHHIYHRSSSKSHSPSKASKATKAQPLGWPHASEAADVPYHPDHHSREHLHQYYKSKASPARAHVSPERGREFTGVSPLRPLRHSSPSPMVVSPSKPLPDMPSASSAIGGKSPVKTIGNPSSLGKSAAKYAVPSSPGNKSISQAKPLRERIARPEPYHPPEENVPKKRVPDRES